MPLLSPSRILRAATQNASGFKWSETLALPRSAFPARPSAAQLEQYRQRCADDLYAWQKENRPKTQQASFVLHDGPPYANGAVHIGHALNKVLKDLILRWNLSKGKRVEYRPGWDCHGLPIELKALQARRANEQQASALRDKPKQEAAVASGAGMSASDIRGIARTLASSTIEKQKASFREWGVMGDWDKPYKTMDLEFEITQLEVFREMVRKGLISRNFRPVYWSPSSRTALAEAELEYDENHTCTAAFVRMPFVRLPKVLKDNEQLRDGQVSALIWTTTPWTLPANKAIAVHPDIEYAVVSIHEPQAGAPKSEQDFTIVARDRMEYIMSHLTEGSQYTVIVESVIGSQLADGQSACLNIFAGLESPILLAGYVTATSGTGLVHNAPGHGMEDYQLCEANRIGPALAPVDDEGRYTAEAFPRSQNSNILKGLDVQTDGVKQVIEILQNPSKYLTSDNPVAPRSLILATHKFTHRNPIDWRTKQPVIVRATAQWFADISAIKDNALTALEDVTFIPESAKTRLQSFIGGRSQWCISRQRAWGVPIPALYHRETGEACIREESISHIIETIKQKGTDAWFSDAPDDPSWIHPSLAEDPWVRGKDTMDVWFDSGTTWKTLSPRDGQVISDIYLEGTDQHRGWFQSSLLTHIATQQSDKSDRSPKAPFGTLITHGFTLDADGKKMSKSLGNVISPDQIVDGSLLPPLKAKKQRGNKKESAPAQDGPKYDAMGPDVLRLWIASSDYTRDVSVSVLVLQSVQQALQKLRVTFKFLLGVLGEYTQQSRSPSTQALTFADRAILHRLSRTSQSVWDACEGYKFYKAVSDINVFVSSDLSAFYFEIVKDAAYAGSKDVRARTQGVLATILEEMTKMLGPITPHLIEEVWEHSPDGLEGSKEHPLMRIWDCPYLAPTSNVLGEDIDQRLSSFRSLSAAVKIAQEEARNAGHVRSGLACDVVILAPTHSADSSFGKAVESWGQDDELADMLVVSHTIVVKEQSEYDIVTEAEWKYEQSIDGLDARGCKIAVLPPKKQKCVRCWKFTAEEAERPCQRCEDVLREMKAG